MRKSKTGGEGKKGLPSSKSNSRDQEVDSSSEQKIDVKKGLDSSGQAKNLKLKKVIDTKEKGKGSSNSNNDGKAKDHHASRPSSKTSKLKPNKFLKKEKTSATPSTSLASNQGKIVG